MTTMRKNTKNIANQTRDEMITQDLDHARDQVTQQCRTKRSINVASVHLHANAIEIVAEHAHPNVETIDPDLDDVAIDQDLNHVRARVHVLDRTDVVNTLIETVNANRARQSLNEDIVLHQAHPVDHIVDLNQDHIQQLKKDPNQEQDRHRKRQKLNKKITS